MVEISVATGRNRLREDTQRLHCGCAKLGKPSYKPFLVFAKNGLEVAGCRFFEPAVGF